MRVEDVKWLRCSASPSPFTCIMTRLVSLSTNATAFSHCSRAPARLSHSLEHSYSSSYAATVVTPASSCAPLHRSASFLSYSRCTSIYCSALAVVHSSFSSSSNSTQSFIFSYNYLVFFQALIFSFSLFRGPIVHTSIVHLIFNKLNLYTLNRNKLLITIYKVRCNQQLNLHFAFPFTDSNMHGRS